MKPFLLALCMLLASCFLTTPSAFAQDPTHGQIITTIDANHKAVEKLVTEKTDAINESLSKMKVLAVAGKKLNFWQLTITLLPLILYMLIMAILLHSMKKSQISLREILIDKEAKENMRQQVLNARVSMLKLHPTMAPADLKASTDPALSGDEPQEPQEPQSANRFIAFVSALISIALAVCICVFYMYQYFMGNPNIEISNLTAVLYALGLGVIPYGVSKVANIFR